MFVLTPRFVPAFQAPQCGYRVSRPQPRRSQYSSFNHFFSQVDELLSEIDREAQRQAQIEAHLEAQREAHRQRQQRKRTLRAKFAVNQTENGWQVDGDVQGFEQENINILVTDEHTLKITGNTRWQAEKPNTEAQQPEQQTVTIPAESTEEPQEDTEAETTAGASTDSDTESHKSYQPTVEDDYEDLGAEAASFLSASSSSSSSASTPAEPSEPKGKEKAVEQPAAAETAVTQQSQPEVPAQQQQPEEEQRVHGTFERTFRFPERIDTASISASFKDSVLSITVPKAPALQTRRIAIL